MLLGAHQFRADTARAAGAAALEALEAYAPDHGAFGRAVGLPGAERLAGTQWDLKVATTAMQDDQATVHRVNPTTWLGYTIHERVLEKLRTEPVEDLRIDFEDSFGLRPDAEEDEYAAAAAAEVAKGLAEGTLPPFLGIRIKPLSEEQKGRAVRTLDVFLTTLVRETGGKLPPSFVVTLPKVRVPAQIEALVGLLADLERKLRLEPGSLKMDFMVEVSQAIVGADGFSMLPRLLDAAAGRCVAAHFGAFDYTASCGITAAYQTMIHPACDFARSMMQVAYARRGIALVDGATSVLPLPVHQAVPGKPLGEGELRENAEAVQRAWKIQFRDVQHSMIQGFYQGWDLHPLQLPARYAAVYSFFLGGLDIAAERLRSAVEKAAHATLAGDVYEEAATGRGLLNFFLRAVNSGAIEEEEATRLTTLTPAELKGRSFTTLVKNRQQRA
jgi:citrate lyase beta subunit